jgi:hypothetical protein
MIIGGYQPYGRQNCVRVGVSCDRAIVVQAKAGFSRETARRVVRAALLSWPES